MLKHYTICFFFAITSFVLGNQRASAAPLNDASSLSFRSTHIRGEWSAFLSPKKNTLRVSLRVPDGRYRFRFRQVAKPPPQLTRNNRQSLAERDDVTLFQGFWRTDDRFWKVTNRAAADIVNNTLTLWFLGKRTARFYRVVAQLPSKPTDQSNVGSILSGNVLHIPSHLAADCGQHSAPAVQSPPFVSSPVSSPVLFAEAIYSPPRYMTISTDADAELYNEFGAQTNSLIRTLLNAVEAIYTSQVGLRFSVLAQNVFTAQSAQPYTSNESLALLEQFAAYRSAADHLGDADLYHLFTGKDLRLDIVGLSYIGTVCRESLLSAGLSERVNRNLQTVLTAHEIGHSLGATHPEETLFAPPDSLMTGIIAPENNSFSDFSLGEIAAHIDTYGTCLSTTAPSSIALERVLAGVRGSRIRYRIDASLWATSLADCSVKVYGSRRASRLPVNAEQLAEMAFLLDEANTLSEETSLAGSFAKGRGSSRTEGYLRAILSCVDPDLNATSEIVRFQANL